MHGIARFPGLDLGSLSEVTFPTDLAFVVHRRGMTEDLGNISSMWCNQNGAFLRYLVARRELRCGSGTLCDHRGGACPACIMIPETSCVAGNQLLSRAALVGSRAPLWDMDQTPLQAYSRSCMTFAARAYRPRLGNGFGCRHRPTRGPGRPRVFWKASPRSGLERGRWSKSVGPLRAALTLARFPGIGGTGRHRFMCSCRCGRFLALRVCSLGAAAPYSRSKWRRAFPPHAFEPRSD